MSGQITTQPAARASAIRLPKFSLGRSGDEDITRVKQFDKGRSVEHPVVFHKDVVGELRYALFAELRDHFALVRLKTSGSIKNYPVE